MGLDRRRDASTAPTTGYATKNRSGPKSAEMLSRSRLRTARIQAAAKAARLTAPTVQASAARPGFPRSRSRPTAAARASPLDPLALMSSPSQAR